MMDEGQTKPVEVPDYKKQAREYKKHLTELTTAVRRFLVALDAEMQTPSDFERGQRIAKLSNELDLANDRARYFGLGIDYRTDDKKNIR